MDNMVSHDRTLSVHKEHELLRRLEAAGFNDKDAQRVIESRDNQLATNIIRLVRGEEVRRGTDPKRARLIMKPNFFGAQEVERHYGYRPDIQYGALDEVPFPEAVLEKLRHSHVLVAMTRMSVVALHEIVGLPYAGKSESFNRLSFARELERKAVWYLVQRYPEEASTWKTWEEQLALLRPEAEVPTARVLIFTIFSHFLETGERLFGDMVRTASCTFSKDADEVSHICVSFDAEGFHIETSRESHRVNKIGLASMIRAVL